MLRFFLVIILLLCTCVNLSFAQTPSIRFINENGRSLVSVKPVIENGVTYLPIGAMDAFPDLKYRYTRPTKRLILTLKGKKISLRMGNPAVEREAGEQPIVLATPPQVINQQPMLPLQFFTTVLPQISNFNVSYNPTLQRVRITERMVLIPTGTPTPSTESKDAFLLIVDPGHGGTDTGCKGSSGVLEKNIVLALAEQIEVLCEQRGISVLFTRKEDIDRRPIDRIRFANRNRANLFLSLHCNASPSPNEEGIYIYINNSSGKLRSKNPVDSESGMLSRGKIRALSQEDFLEESRQFATHIQKALEPFVSPPIPLTELPMVTLSGVYMPAILIELGYLSSEADEARLTDVANIASMATGIMQGIQTANSAEEAVNRKTSHKEIQR
jgi:N-acetylmuramoyl-L-alanine amidase